MFSLCACYSASYAAVCLRISLKDGTTPSYTLAERPVITFSGQEMNVTTQEASIAYQRDLVEKIDFGDVSSVSENIEETAFAYLDDTIRVPNSEIKVYDLNGSLRASGYDSLSIADLPKAIYIVKTKIHSVKIFKN